MKKVYLYMHEDGVNPSINSKNFIEIAPEARADFDDDGKLIGVEVIKVVKILEEDMK